MRNNDLLSLAAWGVVSMLEKEVEASLEIPGGIGKDQLRAVVMRQSEMLAVAAVVMEAVLEQRE